MLQTLAAVMPAPRQPIELRELPLPQLEPDSALLRVEYSEVCGTDVHLHEGRLAGVPYPIIPGHVTVGTLERIRGRLADIDGRTFAEGDRVTFLDVHRTCHRCRVCLIDKATTRCPARKVYGITYGLSDGLTGGWARHLYLKPGTLCIRLDDVPSTLFMAGGCSLPTALHAVDRAGVRVGDTVLVLGAGPVGLSCVAFARIGGAGRVLCIGAPGARLDVARGMGAEDVLNFTDAANRSLEVRISWVLERTSGRGADVVIEAAGAPEAAAEALRFVRDAGRVVIVGQYTDTGDVRINPHADINRKHLDVRGCWGSDYSHFHRAVEVLRSSTGRAAWACLTTQTRPLSQMNEALADAAAARSIKILVAPWAGDVTTPPECHGAGKLS